MGALLLKLLLQYVEKNPQVVVDVVGAIVKHVEQKHDTSAAAAPSGVVVDVAA